MKKIDNKVWLFIGSLAVIILLFVSMTGEKEVKDIVSPEVASSRAISFIDETYIRGAAVIELIDTVEENGVYKITLDIEGDQFDVYTTLNGMMLFPEGVSLEDRVVFERTIGGFTKMDEEEVCLDDGKPLIYYFGSSDCPFCQWQRPVVTKAMEAFEGYVSFRDNTDSENDLEVFFQYSDGGVPLIVVGCNYFRVGAGGTEGQEEEDKDAISALSCKLTGGQPREVCDELQDIINEI